ncbi:hypothetical protein H4S02_012360 [Coemansia sp. RSA 2611]|nr:hypothetical protein H4S02_012360 [Coemansia sp. RSA 2611]
MSSTGAHALIAAASESPYVRLCDLRNGAFAQSFIAHQSGSSAVAWSPQKPYELASGGLDGKLRVWDIRQTSSHVHEFGSSRKNGCAHDSIVSGLLIADDGLCLFSTGSDRRVCAWNIALPRSPMFDIGTGVDGGSNTSSINTVEMALTPGPNGTTSGAVLFIPSGNSRTVLAVSACTGEQLAQLDGHFGPSLTAAWQSTGNELYTGGTDSNVIAWCAREVLGRDQTELRVDSWSDNDANEDSA